MEYCHFTWTEAWDIPVTYRKWFVERKQKEEKRKEEEAKKRKGRKN